MICARDIAEFELQSAASPIRFHASSTCRRWVLVCPTQNRSAQSIAQAGVADEQLAGSVHPVENPLRRLIAAAMAEADEVQRRRRGQLEARSAAIHPASSWAHATCCRTRCWIPAMPNHRNTHHSFNARNRRPNGTCQSR